MSKRTLVPARHDAAVSFPLLFAALTGRSGHGLTRMGRIRAPIRSASGSNRLRPAWILIVALVVLAAGCGNSADPDTWEEAEQDDRFATGEFSAESAVEHNFMESCMEANTENLTEAEARVLCGCSFDGLRTQLTLDEFRSLDGALRSTPNPSDLEEEPEDLWDDIAEGIFESCARRVDA